MTHPALAKPQRGMTPVEMLIGLVLSLALVAGMGQLLVTANGASRTESAQSQTQDAGRLAVELIGRELRKAGYRADRQLGNDYLFPLAAPFSAGAVLTGDDTSLTLRYTGSGDPWTRSCLGDNVALGAMSVQVLRVEGGQLQCRARNLATGTDQTQVLLSNIEAMHLNYGLDNDGDSFPDAYVGAAGVTDWSRVASVRLQLRTVSQASNINDQAQPYLGFDGVAVTPSDRRLRRTYGSVIALRNRLP